MATEDQINIGRRGGGRLQSSKHIALALVSGVIGLIGTGAITAGSGATTDGTYPVTLTGGTLATNGAAATGNVIIVSGAISSFVVTSPGAYTAGNPPTAIPLTSIAGLTGASFASITTGQIATGSVTLPSGTRTSAIKLWNPTATAGSPTNVNVTAGLTIRGADFVSAVDLKAQGMTSLTLVAAGLAELLNGSGVSYYVTAVVVGVTVAVGTMTAEIFYSAPNPGS